MDSQPGARGITSRIARRGVDSSELLGGHQWVVERTLSQRQPSSQESVRYERWAGCL